MSVPRKHWPRTVVIAAGGYGLAGGLVTLSGWVFDIRGLTDWEGNGISMMPNAAIASMAVGSALLLLSSGRRRAAAALGMLSCFIGAATLSQYFTGIDLGIDRLVAFREWGQRGTVVPGRMGPPGSTSFALLGFSVVLAAFGRTRRYAVLGGGLAIGIALLSLIGYVLGADPLYTLPHLTSIALQTSTIVMAIGMGVLAAVPEAQPVRTLSEESAAGVLVRESLPAILILPILLALVRQKGQESGLYDTAFGIALLVLGLLAFLIVLLWRAAAAVHAHEAPLKESRERTAAAAEALRIADRRKDEFLAMLAHELRNPLAPVRNSLEIMKRAVDYPELMDQARDTMDRQVSHLERLIDDLLDVSRITENKLELRRERVSLGTLLEHAVDSCAPLAAGLQHRLALTLPPEPIELDGDPVRLVQVFGNLLSNACKFTPPGGSIVVSAERRGNQAVVRVTDDGIGIPSEMLLQVFEIFAQGDRTLERAHGGLGIGLTLVKQLVEMHEGTVEASSNGSGRGSEFTVRLPIPTSTPAGASPVASTSVAGVSRRVLVVDDNRDSAESLAMLLQLRGHETRVAFDGMGAVEVAEQFRPQVVLLDIGLPKLNGLEACRRIRQQPWGRDMKIVAISGWAQDTDRQNSRAAGFDHHVVKPVDHAALEELLAG